MSVAGSTPQRSLCSSDPSDQSCTADLSLFSLFILSASASTRFHPSTSSLYPLPSLPACFPSLLTLFFCFVTAHLCGDGLMLVLSEATLPEHSTLGNMQICLSFNPTPFFLFHAFSLLNSVSRELNSFNMITFSTV